DQPVVVDAPFISAKGLGVSFEFAFTVAAKLFQDNKDVDWQADHIYFSNWPLNH
ncbi:DJ-1 family protein, partial [Vibrio parahaemolyticus]